MTTHPSEVPTLLIAARADVADQELVGLERCTDWLLDLLNAVGSADSGTRATILRSLPEYVNGNFRTTRDFLTTLDHVELSHELEAGSSVVEDLPFDASPA